MTIHSLKRIALVAGFAGVALPAMAQEFYVGLTYGQAQPSGGTEHAITSVYAGGLFGRSSIAYGGEIEFSIAQPELMDGTTRLRGVVHNDLGGLGTFATLGLSQYGLIGGGQANGVNYGLGIDYGVTDRIDVRLEAMRDILWDADDVNTIRLGVSYGF